MATPRILEEDRLLSIKQILGDPHADPPEDPIIPVSKSTWWAGVKSGLFPPPVKLGPRLSRWRARDIQKIVNEGVQA